MSVPYPTLQPKQTYRLKVSALQELSVEDSGNHKGKHTVIVHARPGGGLRRDGGDRVEIGYVGDVSVVVHSKRADTGDVVPGWRGGVAAHKGRPLPVP